jgi:hypothetical protein
MAPIHIQVFSRCNARSLTVIADITIYHKLYTMFRNIYPFKHVTLLMILTFFTCALVRDFTSIPFDHTGSCYGVAY